MCVKYTYPNAPICRLMPPKPIRQNAMLMLCKIPSSDVFPSQAPKTPQTPYP
jgi:hypothetical protein